MTPAELLVGTPPETAMRTRTLAALSLVFALAGFAAADDHPVVASAKKELKHPDKPFAMWVSVTAKAGKEKELEDAFLACQKDTRKEKGCVAYDINGGKDRKYFFYEKWKNVDGLAAHVAAEHTKTLLAKFTDLLDGEVKIEFLPTVGD
jgi:quinol monooxygenase YgiN